MKYWDKFIVAAVVATPYSGVNLATYFTYLPAGRIMSMKKIIVNPSGIEPPTFRLVVRYLKDLLVQKINIQ